MTNSFQDKASRIFEYISKVYSIDLPVNRDIRDYAINTWWIGQIEESEQCYLKKSSSFVNDSSTNESWLGVKKKSYKSPPAAPKELDGWIQISNNPTELPRVIEGRSVEERFIDNTERVNSYKEYVALYNSWLRSKTGRKPNPPELLQDWLYSGDGDALKYQEKLEITVHFHDSANRTIEFDKYVELWNGWSNQVMPSYKANLLYDSLYSLYQRFTVEGDRLEIIWGHVFLSWKYSEEISVYHPLIITPLNLEFDISKRMISLSPSQSFSTSIDIDCLSELSYPLKDELIAYSRNMNSDGNSELDPWNDDSMNLISSTITGYLSNASEDLTNKYTKDYASKPALNDAPNILNAPVIIVRERTRKLFVDDALNVANAIRANNNASAFIHKLASSNGASSDIQLTEIFDEEQKKYDIEDESLLPLAYNEQQEEIVTKLHKGSAVLVQGPPGTGKSHTIANVICSLLAKGKKVLVTSQTENALKVLRNYIPKDIRSLCVSQLGADSDSKRQLSEAVEAIGNNLSKKDSELAEKNILRINKELDDIRSTQARLLNQIKGWVEVDKEEIVIDGIKITAHKAAIECSEGESDFSWFTDDITPKDAPPLSDADIKRYCELVEKIDIEDIKAFERNIPDLNVIKKPDSLLILIENIKQVREYLREKSNLKTLGNSQKLAAISDDVLTGFQNTLEKTISDYSKLTSTWQQDILNMMFNQVEQKEYWLAFFNKCKAHREKAWISHKALMGAEVTIGELKGINLSTAFKELNELLGKGKSPSQLISRLTMSSHAKKLYDEVRVDGMQLENTRQLVAAQNFIIYQRETSAFSRLWSKLIVPMGAERLSIDNSLPLRSIDASFKKLDLIISWMNHHENDCKSIAAQVGYPDSEIAKTERLEEILNILAFELNRRKLSLYEQAYSQYKDSLLKESKRDNSHKLWISLYDAVSSMSFSDYESAFKELDRMWSLTKHIDAIKEYEKVLTSIVPLWADNLKRNAMTEGASAVPHNWEKAWRWKRLSAWLLQLHNRESIDSLQIKLERNRKKELELVGLLVAEMTWKSQLENVQEHQYRALTAWANAMRLYGIGTGKHAHKHLKAATRAMVDAVEAVPAWIMPIHRVIQSFKAEPNIFDVIIVDEASQCDLRALPVLFRGKKVLVVGDPEQISPSNVGIDREKIFELNNQFLSDIPHADTLFLIDNSLYNITESLGLSRILLTEHFRCIPEIIEFNNNLCPSYAGRLEPLRQPNPSEMLEPSISAIYVEDGFISSDGINKNEAEALVNKVVECCNDPRYLSGGKNNRKRTMGVISLLGEKHAKTISSLLAEKLDETEIEERRLICGDAYAFQGDERDVMFLSLVIGPNKSFSSLTTDTARQRFNVATSRARDQVFLFYSVNHNSITNINCVRNKLLNWYLNPPRAQIDADISTLKEKADSPFEIEVGERIIKRGYKVIPQYLPFPNDRNYKIDLVVQGDKNRVAVECDGDRWHGIERWEYDQKRETQLRRAGWKFWRISGSSFYRNKDASLDTLWSFLEEQGVFPHIDDNKETIVEKTPNPVQEIHLTSEVLNSDNDSNDDYNEASSTNETIVEAPSLPFEAEVVQPNDIETRDIAQIGDIVKVIDLTDNDKPYSYTLSDMSNKIPAERAILGNKVLDEVEYASHSGDRRLKIIEILKNSR